MIVRDLTNSWSDVTVMYLNASEPICVILRKVLGVVFDCSDEFGVLCMCTFVTDLCTSLFSKNEKFCGVDVIIDTLISYILEQDSTSSKKFICWLDNL